MSHSPFVKCRHNFIYLELSDIVGELCRRTIPFKGHLDEATGRSNRRQQTRPSARKSECKGVEFYLGEKSKTDFLYAVNYGLTADVTFKTRISVGRFRCKQTRFGSNYFPFIHLDARYYLALSCSTHHSLSGSWRNHQNAYQTDHFGRI